MQNFYSLLNLAIPHKNVQKYAIGPFLFDGLDRRSTNSDALCCLRHCCSPRSRPHCHPFGRKTTSQQIELVQIKINLFPP